MDAVAVLERLTALGVQVTPRPNGNLWLEPASVIPLDVLELVRQHKAEVVAYLTKPNVVDAPPQWHAEEIKRRVEMDGLCVFWSDLFGEPVAFIADESFRTEVPAGVVCYDVEELERLFGGKEAKLSDSALKLIHEGKKRGGGHIADHWTEGGGNGDG